MSYFVDKYLMYKMEKCKKKQQREKMKIWEKNITKRYGHEVNGCIVDCAIDHHTFEEEDKIEKYKKKEKRYHQMLLLSVSNQINN